MVAVLSKQDESIPRSVTRGASGRVIPQPRDAKATSWPPCRDTSRSGAEVRGYFVAPSSEVVTPKTTEA
jgi:hypothetical protein